MNPNAWDCACGTRNDNSLTECHRCGRGRVAAPEPTIPMQVADHAALKDGWRWLALMGLLGVLNLAFNPSCRPGTNREAAKPAPAGRMTEGDLTVTDFEFVSGKIR